MSDWTLCVDFGTAFSKAAAAPAGAWARFKPSDVRPLQLNARDGVGNAFLLDSAVFVDTNRVLFGGAAVARADAIPGGKRAALKSFKTLLSAPDLERALNTKAPLSIDPHRGFRMRDMIVLYLAYLLAAIERARALDGAIKGKIVRRYAAPAWQDGDPMARHAIVKRLFGEAETLRTALGEALLSDAGVPLAQIASAMSGALERARPLEMSLVHEATAAVAYTSIGLAKSASHLIVVDMGAGTTDFAALARVGEAIVELPEARATLNQAGDFLDRVIANRVLDAASWLKTTEQKTALWAELLGGMRDMKATLFEAGRLGVRHGGRVVTVQLRDIERDKDFVAFEKDLRAAFEQCVAVARGDAILHAQSSIETVAVGGGAAAPFIQSLIAASKKRGPNVTPRPATPDWAHAEGFRGNLAPVFPQLAIAIGGALAPDSMLAAKA